MELNGFHVKIFIMSKQIDTDVNGKISSKRYWAKRFFTLGYWSAIGLFVTWVIMTIIGKEMITVPEELVEIWKWMMGFASAVILGTVFEKPKPKNEEII
jgi:hypothetical protein